MNQIVIDLEDNQRRNIYITGVLDENRKQNIINIYNYKKKLTESKGLESTY